MNKSQKKAQECLKLLKQHYKKSGPFANWSNVLELVVATMLSAQCTDARVNVVTPELFRRYKTAKSYKEADREDLERLVYSTGYYKSKARHLKAMGALLEKEYGGKVPTAFKDLIRIPGISKKSACIIGAKAFGKYYGVAVDTHVFRVAPRLGWTREKNRDKVALDLEKLFPKKEYLNVNEFLIMLGRDVCIPRIPKCEECVLRKHCSRIGV
jgi:endonuclease-3